MNLTARLKKLLTRPYPTIPATTAHDLITQRRAILLDVREKHEWNAGHAPAARHLPLGTLPTRLTELPTDRPIITVCHTGMRSARAAAILARHGHEVYNLRGGMRAWAGAGLPTTTRTGGRSR